MTILLMNSQFDGAYGSLNDFITEIFQALIKMGYQVHISKSAEDAVKILNNNNVEMSIGIGKYNFYINGSTLYDIYHIKHYQWIIDNPYKMHIDSKSKYIKYLLIDYKFRFCIGCVKNTPIFLPLGVPDRDLSGEKIKKTKGLVFAGQIRNVDDIYREIKNSNFRKEILDIVDSQIQNINTSFIDVFENNVSDAEDNHRREIFRLSNSYIRAYKREKVLSSIVRYPVYVIGDNYSDRLAIKNNIIFLGKIPYNKVENIMRRYYYSLNIEPNFNDGFHDRLLRSINNENCAVTNFGKLQYEVFHKEILYYNYDNATIVDEQLEKNSISRLKKMNENAKSILKQYFSWETTLKKIINDCESEWE